MPLFVCSKCKGIDNTACGGNYWTHQINNEPCLCSECHTGIWKAPFPKRIATPEVLNIVGRDNFINMGGM